jgi:hypothetical protein
MKNVPATTVDVVEPILEIRTSEIDIEVKDVVVAGSSSLLLDPVVPFKDVADVIATFSDNNGVVTGDLGSNFCDRLLRCGCNNDNGNFSFVVDVN